LLEAPTEDDQVPEGNKWIFKGKGKARAEDVADEDGRDSAGASNAVHEQNEGDGEESTGGDGDDDTFAQMVCATHPRGGDN
jgi:hypothetical protein